MADLGRLIGVFNSQLLQVADKNAPFHILPDSQARRPSVQKIENSFVINLKVRTGYEELDVVPTLHTSQRPEIGLAAGKPTTHDRQRRGLIERRVLLFIRSGEHRSCACTRAQNAF